MCELSCGLDPRSEKQLFLNLNKFEKEMTLANWWQEVSQLIKFWKLGYAILQNA